MNAQTKQILQILAAVVVAYFLYSYFIKKEYYQNVLTEGQIPLYNDIGPRAVSAGSDYATLGRSCSTCN